MVKPSGDKTNGRWIWGATLTLVGLLVAGAMAGCGLLTGGLVPGVPADFSVTDGLLVGRVRLSWSPVAEAGGYEVWRATSSGGEYAFIGATAHPSYDDTSAMPGTTYWYKVRACNRAGCSEFTTALPGRALSELVPPVPAGLTVSQGTFADRVRVSWQASARATSYELYRGAAADGPFTLVAVVEETSYDDTDVAAGEMYWYKVRACSGQGCSGLSAAVSGYAASQGPAVPQGVTASDGTEAGKVVVTWQAVARATSYLVYRALAADATPELRATVTETTYEDTAVAVGTTYWYWVRACAAEGCSALSTPDSGYPAEGNGEEPPPPPPTTSL